MKKNLSFAVAALSLLVACTDKAKAPAEAAVQAADQALAALADVPRKYMPAETQALEQSVAAAKELLAKKDYKGALATAGEIPAKAGAIVAAANTKHNEVMAAWGEASGPLPQMIAVLKSRLESFALLKKLPDGLEQGTLDEATAGVAAIEAGLGEAQAQANGGDYPAATAKAAELKAKALALIQSLAK